MTLLRILLACTLLLGSRGALAGQADLALAASLSPAAPHHAGQSIEVTFTVTNLGPNVAGADSVGPLMPVSVTATVRVDDRDRLPVTFTTRDAIACPLENVPVDPAPGQRSGTIYVLYFPRLAVGESRTCRVDARIDMGVSSDQFVRWTAFSAQDIDPNPGNSSATLVFGLAPLAVPALQIGALVSLAIFVLLGALRNRGLLT